MKISTSDFYQILDEVKTLYPNRQVAVATKKPIAAKKEGLPILYNNGYYCTGCEKPVEREKVFYLSEVREDLDQDSTLVLIVRMNTYCKECYERNQSTE